MLILTSIMKLSFEFSINKMKEYEVIFYDYDNIVDSRSKRDKVSKIEISITLSCLEVLSFMKNIFNEKREN